jgi:hypothetical protein
MVPRMPPESICERCLQEREYAGSAAFVDAAGANTLELMSWKTELEHRAGGRR